MRSNASMASFTFSSGVSTAFDRTETETLAVVDNTSELRLVGLLTEKYAARRYAEELDKANQGLLGA